MVVASIACRSKVSKKPTGQGISAGLGAQLPLWSLDLGSRMPNWTYDYSKRYSGD
jgi:hypothetical protein